MSGPEPDPGARRLRVRVPCSTSNLGPGFDLLGLALSLYLEVELRGPAQGAHALERAAGRARDWPAAGNLLFRAFDLAAERLELGRPTFRFAADSQIPVSRGLGSSGAAVAAGLLLAAALAEQAVDRAQLCRWGAELEGHPDNSTASLLGGCTLAAPVGEGLVVVRQELAPELCFGVAWPAETVSTQRARAVLPREVAFPDAVENPRRLALLLEGLRRGDRELLRLGAEDRLHVAYRLPLIPGAARALAAAREAGAWLATISGSGSSLIAVGARAEIESITAALAAGLGSEHVERRVLEAVARAPEVCALDHDGA